MYEFKDSQSFKVRLCLGAGGQWKFGMSVFAVLCFPVSLRVYVCQCVVMYMQVMYMQGYGECVSV